MKLAELYSLSTGLKLGDQELVERFYPLPFERYVTLQGGSGMLAKNYPFYTDVVKLLRPALEAAEIKIVQLGGKDDHQVLGVHSLTGKTDIHQSSYILRNSLCHFGNDSWLSHRGGALNVPLVILFGPTTPQNHGPLRSNPKSVFIESHRFGRRAAFASQENPPTIALIPPEQVANAVLTILGLPTVTDQTICIGDAYNVSAVEMVPTAVINPQIQVPNSLIIRMDLAKDWPLAERALAENLQLRKCAVITDREINPQILAQFKPNLTGLRVIVDRVSAGWIKAIKRTGVPIAFVSHEKDERELRDLRMALYDACLFDHFVAPTKADLQKGVNTYLNKELDIAPIIPRLRFKTNKFLLADNQVYLSEAHWKAGKNTPSSDQNAGDVIDDPAFWIDIAHYHLYTT